MVRARILIVEDEPQLRGLLRLYLERAGYAVSDAGDGAAALAAFAADGADLVVLDLMLPGMQGEAVLEGLREAADVPILITSAKRSDAERIAGLRLGADDYLAKPFNPHELTARVAAILRRSRPGTPGQGDAIISLACRAPGPGSDLAALHAGRRRGRPPDAGRGRPAGRAGPSPGCGPGARAAARGGGAPPGRGVRARGGRPRRQPAPQARATTPATRG